MASGIGLRLRQARHRARLSQQALAELAGMNRVSVTELEGGREAKVCEVVKLHGVLVEAIPDLQLMWLLTGDPAPGRVEPGVRRREFLGVSAGAVLAAAGLDVIGAEAVTEALLAQWYTVPPASLLPAVLGHLEGIRGQAGRSREGASIVAKTALLAAHSLGKADDWAPDVDAYEYYALAETAARDAGARALLAVALASRSAYHSTVARGWRDGDPKLARELLEEAARLAPARGRVRVEVFARLGEEKAAVGDARGAMHDLEIAETALQEPADGEGRVYFGARNMVELNAIRGHAELLLGQHEKAIETLGRTYAAMNPQLAQWRAAVLADQGAAYARAGELDAAVDRLERALQLARIAGDHISRVAGVRERDLAGRDAEPAVCRLDEQLTASQ